MATFTAVKNKTQSGNALSRVLAYVGQEAKTLWEEQQLVSGWNCVARSACDEMMMTKRRFGKTDGRMFYQFVQSFDPAEAVTPREAHAIGMELAQKLFPDFEVLVATHVDTDHLHSHLVVNSVSCVTGCKLHQNAADLQRQRQVSDGICLAHGLTVLAPPKKYAENKTMRSGEYRSAVRGESWKFQLMNTIDLCMRKAKGREDFIREMGRRGYQVRWERTRRAITYTTPKGMKCRDDRLHEDKYRKEVMEREFRIRETILHRRVEETESAAGGGDNIRTIHTLHDGETVDTSAECPERPAAVAGGSGRYNGEDALRNQGNDRAGGEADQRGSGNPSTAPTGWEEERAEAFSAAVEPAPTQSGLAVGHPGPGRIADSLVRLGFYLGQLSEPADTDTPVTGHGERKSLSKEREKKIAMGHKPDDHENSGPTMSM